MTNWEQQIIYAMEKANDTSEVIDMTLTDRELHQEFDNGYGGEEGVPFTLWTEKRVYFPICYDGAEWVGSAPRNPCDEKLEHQGG